jgi:hypothetical protein
MPNQYEALTKERAEATVSAWKKAGQNAAAAARTLRESPTSFRQRLQRSLDLLGLVPPTTAPDGMRLSGTTIQYDANGDVVNEWRRLHPEAETLEAIASRLCETVAGKAPKLPRVTAAPDDLLLEVPIFDPHFGKYAWARETGTDYDLDICKHLVVNGVASLAQRAGKVGTALLVIGGDWFHSDTRHNRTERGDNPLDVDTRQALVWEAVTDSITASVRILAEHAARVRIVVIPGNHDWESSYHLARVLAAYYRNETGVDVVNSPRSRQYVRHGTVLLGFAHGHLVKMDDLPSLMAMEAPADWAASTERVWHQGHIHKSKTMRWIAGDGKHSVQVEHLESLSGTDAWHHEMGFVGMPRRLCGFLWSAKHGLRQRIYTTVDELSDSDKETHV